MKSMKRFLLSLIGALLLSILGFAIIRSVFASDSCVPSFGYLYCYLDESDPHWYQAGPWSSFAGFGYEGNAKMTWVNDSPDDGLTNAIWKFWEVASFYSPKAYFRVYIPADQPYRSWTNTVSAPFCRKARHGDPNETDFCYYLDENAYQGTWVSIGEEDQVQGPEIKSFPATAVSGYACSPPGNKCEHWIDSALVIFLP